MNNAGSSMNADDECCEVCRFWVDSLCHRHAPPAPIPYLFSAVAMLQAMANVSLGFCRVYTPPPKEGEKIYPDDEATIDANVFADMTELFEPEKWPEVKPTDWCGEFERRVTNEPDHDGAAVTDRGARDVSEPTREPISI